jgi:hypothetical protein
MAQDVTRSGGFAVIKSFLRPRLRSPQSRKRGPQFRLTPVIGWLRRHNDIQLQMAGKHHDLMTINDAEGIMTAQRSDGHFRWPTDHE